MSVQGSRDDYWTKAGCGRGISGGDGWSAVFSFSAEDGDTGYRSVVQAVYDYTDIGNENE